MTVFIALCSKCISTALSLSSSSTCYNWRPPIHTICANAEIIQSGLRVVSMTVRLYLKRATTTVAAVMSTAYSSIRLWLSASTQGHTLNSCSAYTADASMERFRMMLLIDHWSFCGWFYFSVVWHAQSIEFLLHVSNFYKKASAFLPSAQLYC